MEAVNKGLQIGIIAQLAITLPIAISLKSMWNLMNIIQILAYFRLYANWPAMIDFQLNQLELAITLKPVSDLVMDFGKSKFQLANETLSDENLKKAGVSDPEMFKTLGIFGFVLIILLILVGIYLILKHAHKAVAQKREGTCTKNVIKIKELLSKKLFYSSFLRYMIVSNLKLTVTIFGFFILTWSNL